MTDLSLLFKQHPDPMWVYDLETFRFLEVNAAATRRYGYSREEFLGMTIREIRPAQDLSRLDGIMSQALSGDIKNIAWTHVTKSGEQFEVDITSQTLEFGGRRAGLVCVRDVSERVRLQNLANITEERFKLIARATNDVIWDWNLETNEMWWNEGIETVYGHARESLESDASSWSKRIHRDDLTHVVNSIHAVQEGTGNSWVSEYRFLHASGAVHYVIDRGFVLRNNQGTAIRMLGSMMDVTEQRALTVRLAQAQKMEAIGHLTGGIAHDFNNLLTVILGNTELIHELTEHGDERQELAAMNISAAKRGAELTRRLLAFARRQTLEPRLLCMNRLVADMQGLLRRSLNEAIELQLVLDEATWPTEIDPNQLESALLNLVINARDATYAGGRVTIETGNIVLEGEESSALDMPAGHYAVLSVSDTGHGMSPETLAQVFEPFFTTKLPGKGTGLGLSMVYGFVKQSGGQARIYSEPGEGTTVRLYFPRAQATQAEVRTEPTFTTSLEGTETILVVEDEELVRRHVVGLMRGMGYVVIEATNGPDALNRLEQHPEIAMLFTDIIMPGGLNGRQLAEAVQARRPQVRVLYTSGHTENAIVHHGRLDPGTALLNKPYTRRALARRVRAVLDGAN